MICLITGVILQTELVKMKFCYQIIDHNFNKICGHLCFKSFFPCKTQNHPRVYFPVTVLSYNSIVLLSLSH